MNRHILDLLDLNLYHQRLQEAEHFERVRRIHESTPNSSLEFIEHVVQKVGNNGLLDLTDSIYEFEYFPESLTKMVFIEDAESTEDPYECLPFAIKLNNKAKSINDRLTFLYGISDTDLEYDEDTYECIYPKEFKYDESINENVIEYTPEELVYKDINNAAYFICKIFELEKLTGGGPWYKDDIKAILNEKYYLSYRKAYNEPDKLDSLIITKEKPKEAYVTKQFTGIHNAIRYREDLFDDVFDYNFACMNHKYDDDPCDIAAFESTPEIKAKILDYFKHNK